MAKKIRAKDLRQAQNSARSDAIRREQQAREAALLEEKRKQELEAKKKQFQSKLDARRSLPKNQRSSLAKAAGLKSAFAIGNDIYLTSFGKGNSATLEKKINETSVLNIAPSDASLFTVENVTDAVIPINSKRIAGLEAQTDSPIHTMCPENKGVQPDNLMLKGELEKLYFGNTFNDNIHIQIIYNILDIEKILTAHSVNTVYTLNNILDIQDREDYIGKLTASKTYEQYCENPKAQEKFTKLCHQPRLGYYGDAFFADSKTKRCEKDIYDIITLISTLRQICVHYEVEKKAWLYSPEKHLDHEFTDMLSRLYSEAAATINDGFVKDNHVNILILKDKLKNINDVHSDEMNGLIRKYYSFMVMKEHKFLGFSLKKLREKMLADTEYDIRFTDMQTKIKYDPIRSKLYKLIDFALFDYYTGDEGSAEADDITLGLRSAISDEDKENIYTSTASALYKKKEHIIKAFADLLTDNKKLVGLIKNETINSIDISTLIDQKQIENISLFSKYIYLLTRFLDGKEINDLTTTLINKFDNIGSLINVLEQLGYECNFTDDFIFFKDSGIIAEEMKLIHNIARMGRVIPSAKQQMYLDAIDVLGVDDAQMSDTDKQALVNSILGFDSEGKAIKGANKGFRNFIASNVIESSRFKYLVKYCKPAKIRAIASQEHVIRYVLSTIPDSQIERYYLSCNPDNRRYPGRDEAVTSLTSIITSMSFSVFRDVNNRTNATGNSADARRKMQYQTTISLYLTVCYLFVKNLVNINSRYTMAFRMLERDAYLYGITSHAEGSTIQEQDENRRNMLKTDYAALTRYVLADSIDNAHNRYLKNKKWHKLTQDNLDNFDANAAARFRDTVAHLNPIRNADLFICGLEKISSYYEAYHYLVQKSVIQRIQNTGMTEATAKYVSDINQYNSYSKDFVKALCVPFAYNIVRFKNLTVYELFDRNYTPESDCK